MQEIEYKFKVDSHDEIIRALRQNNAKPSPMIEQTDCFFDWPDSSIRSGDKCLRIRTLKQPGQPDKYEITYKGPRQDAAAKIRSEYETAITEPDKMEKILLALGMSKIFTLQKRRTTYHMDSCKVELDELPYIGCFVEIEGPTVEQIDAVKQLIAPAATHINQSYAALISKYCKDNNIDSCEIIFS